MFIIYISLIIPAGLIDVSITSIDEPHSYTYLSPLMCSITVSLHRHLFMNIKHYLQKRDKRGIHTCLIEPTAKYFTREPTDLLQESLYTLLSSIYSPNNSIRSKGMTLYIEELYNYTTTNKESTISVPPGFVSISLRPYQLYAVEWMRQHEQQSTSVNPFFTKFSLPDTTPFYISHLYKRIQLSPPNGGSRGGILGDVMGLGKSIEILALLLQDKVDPPVDSRGNILPRCNLLIWRNEFKTHIQKDLFNILIYYDSIDTNICFESYDVCITTYDKVVSIYTKDSSCSLFTYTFRRIFIDEGHYIKNHTSLRSEALFHLKANYRWIITGTPIHNSILDLYSYCKFLQLEPWQEFSLYKRYIVDPYEEGDSIAIQIVKSIMSAYLLRRTKDDIQQELPPKYIYNINLPLSKEEDVFYRNIYICAKAQYKQFIFRGVVKNKYTRMLTLLLFLRQACDHPYLLIHGNQVHVLEDLNSHGNEDIRLIGSDTNLNNGDNRGNSSINIEHELNTHAFIENIYRYIYGGEYESKAEDGYLESTVHDLNTTGINNFECPVCLETSSPAMLQCAHFVCNNCIRRLIKMSSSNSSFLCPLCRKSTDNNKVVYIHMKEKATFSKSYNIDLDRDYIPSSKIDFICNKIKEYKEKDNNIKILIYTQWIKMIDILQLALSRCNISTLRFDGSLTQQDREKVLNTFMNSTINILILSLSAGGVGLNLTVANVVFICDPWWNPFVEDQAIDRVHRIGQKKPVYIYRLHMENTVEMKIQELQNKKLSLADNILNFENNDETNKLSIEELCSFFE
ncbi:hypothetical protein WA158_003808 [Blastocystis sp. Blastoise]